MARKVRDSRLESRSSRLKLAIRGKPYTGPSLARGIMLLYRRNRTNGSWVVKTANGAGDYWTSVVGKADDFEDSDGQNVLSFFEAQTAAKKLARGDDSVADSAAPITVDGALKLYKSDLVARGADPYNADWPRVHLTGALLGKPVMLLDSDELMKWRNSLLDKIAPATVSRLCNAICAALELARKHDKQKRIQNRQAWEDGLEGLGDGKPHNVVISDAHVGAFVRAAYAKDGGLGLLTDLLAVTGARPSQAVRLCVADLQDHPLRPKLMMPKSGKGGGRDRSKNKQESYSVPITEQLAARLKAAAKGRAGDEPLLLNGDGQPWRTDPSKDYSRDVREIVKAIGLDPDLVTMYALRHSSINRQLFNKVPIRLVAALHNTSVGQIERTYSNKITENDNADDEVRGKLLQHEQPEIADNIITLTR